MDVFLQAIDSYISSKNPNFGEFYDFFQNQYFLDVNKKRNESLGSDEAQFLDKVNDKMSLVGQNPDKQEREDGIEDQNQFRDWLIEMRKQNSEIWRRYNLSV